MKLFSEDLGEIKSDEALEVLKVKYSQYDPGYICQSAYVLRASTKKWLEMMWKIYQPYADFHFLTEFKRQFSQRSWELYLGVTLIRHGYDLEKGSGNGPDFKIKNKDRIVWIEAVSVTKGRGEDKVPETKYNVVSSIPTEEMLLRISKGLDDKFTKYKKYLNEMVSKDDPFVIALDRSELEHLDAMMPNILKVAFGIGHFTYHVKPGEVNLKKAETSWSVMIEIQKKNGKKIPTAFFLNKAHSGVSAVIYSKDSIINSPRGPKQMGENLVTVHNPNATNPLPHNFFKFGEEYSLNEDYIERVRKHKRFQRPNPFRF